jgi:hypothetical protein
MDDSGIRFGVANGVLIVSFLAAAALRLDPAHIAWAAVLTVGLSGVALPLSLTAPLGVIAWAWFTGFVENRYGELTFTGDDLQRLVVFVVTASALAFALGRAGHGVTSRRRRRYRGRLGM